MALDRQRILNELGSVMNQLKSADCGCMGKLFGNPGQFAVPQTALPIYGGCRRGCCHGHGYGRNPSESCGETYSSNAQNNCSPCMGNCNPPKLYADTYNYLTENLMQPAVKEVYNDLQSLTPANTIVNNPIANQMGLANNDLVKQGNMDDKRHIFSTNNQFHLGNMGPANVLNNSNQPNNVISTLINDTNEKQICQMGGMGPQIMNMLGGNMSNQNNMMGRQGLMVTESPPSAQSQVGVTPLSTSMNNKYNSYNSKVYASNHNVSQNAAQPKLPPGEHTPNMNTNPSAQQMPTHYHPHGQHSQGVAKFNEMFPGVMKGLGGDLGFDPMEIAIQMNPANKQQAAMDKMHKMMQNNDINKVFDQSGNAAALAPPMHNAQLKHLNEVSRSSSLQVPNESITQNITPTNQIDQSNVYQQRDMTAKHNLYGNSNTPINVQQIYTASTANQLPLYQHDQQLKQIQEQSLTDSNTGSFILPPTLPVAYEAVTEQQNIKSQITNNTFSESPNVQQMINEPIFPADTSRYSHVPPKQKYFEYNTLGQPIEMLSAKTYRTTEPALPQTLSPQPIHKFRSDPAKYSTVKSTESKTSIMGNKPIGQTPSQLQQIYDQYKGSQSYTQRNIVPPTVKRATHSEGKIPTLQVISAPQQIPLEKVGGDTTANNQTQDERVVKFSQVRGHIGDVLVGNKPFDELLSNKEVPVNIRKCRNGLQDIVFTSYPSSAAWSFHGANTVPCGSRYRYRK